MSELDRLGREVRAIARRAGAAILEIYAGSFAVERKSDDSPLTAADMAAHHAIVDGLHALTPAIPVLSEESAGIPWSTRATWTRYWLVDPLDGTREFVKRNGEFTVNIALIENHVPVLGAVLAPVSGELYFASADAGACVEHSLGAMPRSIEARAAAQPPVVAGSRSHAQERTGAMLARLGDHRLMAMGSSLKFCLIAAGKADLYLRLGPTSEWDTAAAQCVLEQAGGAVLDLFGAPLRYNARESLINPEFIAVGDPSANWLGRLQTQ